MGGTFSESIPRDPSDGLVAIVLRSYDKVRLLHAPRPVLDLTQRISRELGETDNCDYEDKHGSMQIRLPGSPFSSNGGRESATIGRLFIIKFLEEMHIIGYDLVASTNLSRAVDQATLILREVPSIDLRNRSPIISVAPYGTDRLILTRCGDQEIDAVRRAIESSWTPGIQQEFYLESPSTLINEQPQFEFKLRGNPWTGEGEVCIMYKQLIFDVICNLSMLHWKLHVSVSLRKGSDVMFFIRDQNYDKHLSDLAMLTLGKSDRITLFNLDSIVRSSIKATILRFHQTKEPEEKTFDKAFEFKLKGYPFACTGEEAISTRQFMCRLFESLREFGWEVINSLQISSCVNERSIFILSRCNPAKIKYACLAPADVDSLFLLNFPITMNQTLLKTISRHYMPGICSQEARDAGSFYQIVLQGPPWTQNSSYNLHARSMILRLLKAASSYGWNLVASADVSSKILHQENSHDFPADVHSLFFSFAGLPKGVEMPKSAASITYSELKVSDLEDLEVPSQ